MYAIVIAVLLGWLATIIGGTIRLMDGPTEFEGRLELYYNNEWGTVCSNQWHNHDGNAIVACRQLGYSGGDFTRIYKKKKKTFLFDNVICNGMENTLEACQLDVLTNPNCAGPDDFEINVICEKNQNATTPNLGEIRLMNGKDRLEGRVEIYLRGAWQAICQYSWGTHDSRVVCRQLGFNGGSGQYDAEYGKGYGTPRYVQMNCRGSEHSLVECDTFYRTCSQQKTTGVICEAPIKYGKSCKLDELCEGNTICIAAGRNKVCRCNKNMFWSKESSTCQMKRLYNESCLTDVPDNCDANLACTELHNSTNCLCVNDLNWFWDEKLKVCKQKSLHEEACYIDNPDSCSNDLVCTNLKKTYMCLCANEVDTFWDKRDKRCKQRLLYNDICYVDSRNSCGSNLVCSQLQSRCLCENDDNDLVWYEPKSVCLTKNLLKAVYVDVELTYRNALSYCTTTLDGRLVTKDHLQDLLGNCTRHVNEIWLYRTSAQQNKSIPSVPDTCHAATNGYSYDDVNCTRQMAFICIVERGGKDDLFCQGFPTFGTNVGQRTTFRAALICGVAIGLVLLVFTVATIYVIVYKRKQMLRNNTGHISGHSKSNQRDPSSFQNNAYDINSLLTEKHAYTETRPRGENAYTMIEFDEETPTHNKICLYSVDQETNPCDTGYIDMAGSVCSPPRGAVPGTRDDYTVCSNPNMADNDYNTFAKLAAPNVSDDIDVYDHIRTSAEGDDGYDVFKGKSHVRGNLTAN